VTEVFHYCQECRPTRYTVFHLFTIDPKLLVLNDRAQGSQRRY